MSAVEKLAREILDTRRLALGHATAPQLGYGSLDGGRIDFRDWDGNLVGGIGIGEDGGIVVDYDYGPKPGSPSRPTVTADSGIFRVEWDGTFVPDDGDGSQDGQGLAPTSDLDRVEVHASMDENFVPDRVQSFAGAFSSLDGGSFVLGPLPEAGTYYFRLVARSKAGKFSAPSERVEQELAIASMDLAVTDAWLTGEAAQTTADGKNSIWRGPDEPDPAVDGPFKDGDIWFEMTEDGKSIPNIWDETTGTWVANDDKRQSDIERVQQELREDLDAVIVDGSGTKNFYTPDMPTEGMSEGDLWFDPSDKNKPYIYQDGEWITVRDQFLKPPTTRNVTDWGLLKPNLNAVEGQWSSTPYRVEVEPLEAINNSPLAVVNIPNEDLGGGYITMPFQGVLDGSDYPDHSDDLFVYEGRPISLDLQLMYNGPFEPNAAQRTLTAHYFAEGVLVDSRSIDYASLKSEIHPAAVDLSNPVAYYAHILGYQYGMRITGTVAPTEVASVDEVALTVAIPLPAGRDAEKKIAIWSIDSRVQVPTTGLADGAITETKISDDSISTPKLQSKVITTDKIAVGAITAESGIIGSINAGTITVGEMNGARIEAGTINADLALIESSIGSTLIKDGAILTDHIKVGAITAESGIIGSIDANVITVGKIMGNQLDADAVNGKTITGAIVRTASSGSRVELTKNGLKQYNSLGATIVDMTSGSFVLQGGTITGAEVRTSASGARVEMDRMGLHLFDRDSRRTFYANANDGSLTMIGDIRTASLGPRVEILKSPTMWGETGSGINLVSTAESTPFKISAENSGFTGSINKIDGTFGNITFSNIGGLKLSSRNASQNLTIENSGITTSTSVNESDWVTVPVRSPFRYYDSSSVSTFKVKKVNGIVTFQGIAGGSGIRGKEDMCTLPSGYRPAAGTRFSAMMQGSGGNTWQLIIYDNGIAYMDRYGPGDPSQNTWYPFYATFAA